VRQRHSAYIRLALTGPALIAVLKATGIRLSELAAIRYDPGDPRRSAKDLWHRAGVLRLTWKRRRRQARPPSRLAAIASTRTTPSPDLCGPRRAPSDVDSVAGEFEYLSHKKPD
jgi:integrase